MEMDDANTDWMLCAIFLNDTKVWCIFSLSNYFKYFASILKSFGIGILWENKLGFQSLSSHDSSDDPGKSAH